MFFAFRLSFAKLMRGFRDKIMGCFVSIKWHLGFGGYGLNLIEGNKLLSSLIVQRYWTPRQVFQWRLSGEAPECLMFICPSVLSVQTWWLCHFFSTLLITPIVWCMPHTADLPEQGWDKSKRGEMDIWSFAQLLITAWATLTQWWVGEALHALQFFQGSWSRWQSRHSWAFSSSFFPERRSIFFLSSYVLLLLIK